MNEQVMRDVWWVSALIAKKNDAALRVPAKTVQNNERQRFMNFTIYSKNLGGFQKSGPTHSRTWLINNAYSVLIKYARCIRNNSANVADFHVFSYVELPRSSFRALLSQQKFCQTV